MKKNRQKRKTGLFPENHPRKYRIWLLFQENYIILKNEMSETGAKIETTSI